MRLFASLITIALVLTVVAGCGPDSGEPTSPAAVKDITAIPASTVVARPTATPVPSPTPTPEPLRTFVHPSGLWQLSYPADSDVNGPKTDEENSFEGFEFLIPFDDVHFVALGVTRIEGHEYPTSMEWSQSVLETAEDGSSSFELISWETVDLEGFQAYEAVYQRRGGSFAFSHIELHLLADTDTYRIVGVAERSAWDEVQELLRTLVHSFRPLK